MYPRFDISNVAPSTTQFWITNVAIINDVKLQCCQILVLTLLTVNEALALSVLKVKLEMQILESGKALSTNAFKDKSLSNTVLDLLLMVLFVSICNIVFFRHFLNSVLMQSNISSIVAPGKDFTFLHWCDILFSSIQNMMESPTMSVVFSLH